MSYNSSLENLLGSKYFTQQNNNNNSLNNNEYKKNSLATTTSSISNTNNFTNPNDFITYIIPDFNAVKYFQKDFVSSNEFYLIEESEVNGFELYICEQWVINRNIGTIVTAYTGNEQSKISVVKFTIIKKPTKYYPIRFQEYLTELIQNHSRMKTVDKERPQSSIASSRANSTNDMVTIARLSSKPPMNVNKNKQADFTNEVCFVTNLTSLPPNLNLIPISSGDARTIEAQFVINSDLKKLQCTGRSVSLTTDKISDASDDKFRQMYKIYNVKVPIKFAVRELVNIIQTCLFYFDLLDGRYCTGLLCVKTEEAINNWWNLIGLPHFNTKPNSRFGILPGTTVAAIISLILSIRLRLQIVGVSDVPKDPFEFENFMLAIGQFQRQNKLEKTRKLDMETMNKLFTVTNSRLMPEKGSNYFYTPYDLDESQDYDLLTSPKPVIPQKRMYGKRELKKITNVMKNTVSDHINAASTRDSEEMINKTSGRIRNKIAKLADTQSPLDVETLDLDSLVKNYLVGKTMTRLFLGVQSSNVLYDDQGRLRNHENKKSVGNNNESHLYNFESLRDRIIQNHDLQLNTKNLGFSRRFGLQSRKNIDNKLAPPTFDDTNRSLIARDRSLQSSSMVDSFLQIGDTESSTEEVRRSSSLDSTCADVSKSNINHPLTEFQRNLNRRNSCPILINPDEENLNSFIHMKDSFTFPPELVEISRTKPRSNSFSMIEKNLRYQSPSVETLTKFSQLYFKNIDLLMRYENLKTHYFESEQDVSNVTMAKSFQLLNVDLMKVKNLKLQMMSNKQKVLEEGVIDHLKFNFNNLTSTVDRLNYETRIVSKKINELEENYKLYEEKLNSDCQKKLKKIIDYTLNSRDFKDLYNIDERKSIALELTGDENYVNIGQDDENMGLFRMIVVFFYELLYTIFKFFKFERNHMNLDRIRQSWVKLDPHKSVIKKTYSYIGRQPSSDSIASSSDYN
ncbi:uncharacterized protein KGF55_000895 [Candida pseudojiufengensis]|uniref:uncharacterized protein n=1 Tax=Candida pseudojiufengensis TaxID=497109 RepID=UPI0022259744|nr:uncharacterized protein KGF55_000895 [Candida pseudojiufengensis]KAI5966585.1 hypothetical protein KGF55_000895 [Candida pseudojiufengensis]